MRKQHSKGMTLIELMVVVAVLATLGTIAVSTYRSYLVRTNRTEAKTALLRVQAAQEKFFLQNNMYATNDQLDDDPPGGLGVEASTPGGFYTLSVVTAEDGMTYTASATAAGAQATDDTACSVIGIRWDGTRTGGDNCWR